MSKQKGKETEKGKKGYKVKIKKNNWKKVREKEAERKGIKTTK
jgi:hypothetical protein